MRRLIILLLAVVMIAAACGSDGGDDSGSDPDAGGAEESAQDGDSGDGTIVTVGALSLELPIVIPGDIPAPSTGVYVGEIDGDEPWQSIHIGSDYDATELRAAVKAWAESAGASYDDSLEQAVLNPSAGTGDQAVYVWVRTTDQGDYATLLEIGVADAQG